MTAGALGLAGLMFGALALPLFLEQHADSGIGPASAASFIVLMAVPLLIGAWGSWAPLPVMLTLATIEAAAFLVVLTLWMLTHGGAAADAVEMPWVLSISALPAVCFALVMRGVYVWAYLGVVGVFNGLITFLATPGDDALLRGMQALLYASSFSAIFVGLVLVGMQSAERLDSLQEHATEEAARNASRLARERERSRFDGLIHDGVISTLLMAGRADALDAEVVRQARDTLVQLEQLASVAPAPSPLSAELFIARVQQLAQSYPVEVFVESTTDAAALELPAEVAEAVLAACGEALRNSIEHAAGHDPASSEGSSALRTIARQLELRLSESAVTVSVRDDGVGFDESQVRPERLGLARSIHGRMGEVVGGYAVVDTRLGQGTAVIVGWVKP